MKLTRNTKLYKSTDGKDTEVIFRTLTITELHVIDNITSQYHKKETAYQIGHISGDTPNYLIQQQIGQDIIESSTLELQDDVLLDLTIDDLRNSVKNDFAFGLMQHIIGAVPGTSIEYLLSLTIKDILELAAFAEVITNKKIFKGTSAAPSNIEIKEEKAFFTEEDGTSLQDKMKDLGNF